MAFCAAAFPPPAPCAPQAPTTWQTGRRFRDQLDTEAAIAWQASPLRHSLAELSRAQRVAIMLDRRVDPGRLVDFSINNVALDAALRGLAEHLGLGVCYVGPVAYVGPKDVTEKLATLAEATGEETSKRWAALRRPPVPPRPWRWEDLTTPRELVEQLAAEGGVEVEGLDRIPHDLWPAADLPPLAFAARLTLVLAGFDLSFALAPDGAAIRLIPMPAHVSITRTYNKRLSQENIAQVAAAFPNANIRQAGNRLIAAGRLEDLQEIERLLWGKRPDRSTDGPRKAPMEKRYSLSITNVSVGAILKTIAVQAQLEVRIDPRAAGQLRKLIAVEVKDATIEELLTKTLEPAGLAFRRTGDTLEITPR
jgi:hypothetical protein